MRTALAWMATVGMWRALDDAAALEPSIDATARAVGVGVAQGNRADTGPNTIGVVVIWAR